MGVSFLGNRSDRVPTTWSLGLFVIFLLGFFTHNSLIVFSYIRMSWMAWRNGIFMYKFFNSSRMSKSGYCIGQGMINHSRNGGEDVVSWLWVCCLFTSYSCDRCSLGNWSSTWTLLSPSVSIICPDLNWRSLHSLRWAPTYGVSMIWTHWTGLLFGFGLGWAGICALRLDWGFCCKAGSVGWGSGIVPTGWCIDLCHFVCQA